MTDDSKETKPAAEPEKTQSPRPAEAPQGEVEGLTEALFPADAEIALLTARVAELEGEKTNLIDRLLRAQADLENFRKRTEREREETAKYAISKFARDVVAVADNFERATAAVAPDELADNPALGALLDGVKMTEREFLNALERHGVTRMAPKGETFDPNVHQAVMEQHDTAVPAGTVLQVYQAGYMIEDRCLRPAMVVVSRGGPKQPKAAPAAVAEAATATTAEPVSESPNGGMATAADAANDEAPQAGTEVADAGPEVAAEPPAEQPDSDAGGSSDSRSD
ncbi:MAG: nucleotide exchange factor GrpE [Pseudomonadota bacterium]